MKKIIGRGAEAILIRQDNKLLKKREKKSYRLDEIDVKLRKLRTRSEGKIMNKLQGKIFVPKILKVNEQTKEIYMEFIEGKKLSEHLDKFPLSEQKKICIKIGQEVGKIHDLDIIHSDLTTSNMILKQDWVYFIDFGLSFQSKKIEDKAVDIHLFKQALESKHFKNWKDLFNCFIKNYKPRDKKGILDRLKKVELRGRYKH